MEGEAGSSATSNSISDCNICLEVAVIPVATKCGHMFCSACLFRWLDSRPEHRPKSCPVCMEILRRAADVIRIYGGARRTGEPRLQGSHQHEGRPITPAVPCALHEQVVPGGVRSGAARDFHEDYPLTPHRSPEVLLASRSERVPVTASRTPRAQNFGMNSLRRRGVEVETRPQLRPHEHQQQIIRRGLEILRRPRTAPTHQPDEGVRRSSRTQGLQTRQARSTRVPPLTTVGQSRQTTSSSSRDTSREQEATSVERRREINPSYTSRLRSPRHSAVILRSSHEQVPNVEASAEDLSTSHRPTTSRGIAGDEHVNSLITVPAPVSAVPVHDEGVGARPAHGESLAMSQLAGGETPRNESTDNSPVNVVSRATSTRLTSAQWRDLIQRLRARGLLRSRSSALRVQVPNSHPYWQRTRAHGATASLASGPARDNDNLQGDFQTRTLANGENADQPVETEEQSVGSRMTPPTSTETRDSESELQRRSTRLFRLQAQVDLEVAELLKIAAAGLERNALHQQLGLDPPSG